MIRLLLLGVLLSGSVQAQLPTEMTRYADREAKFSILHPATWRRETPGGPTKLLIGEPPGDSFILCSVEHAPQRPRLSVPQARLDRDLVGGFKTRDWPQELAGKRNLLDWQVREINGVPMGAIEWERADEGEGRRRYARGIKVFRTTPGGLWSAECAAIALDRKVAEAHFAFNLGLIGEIIGSVRFPR